MILRKTSADDTGMQICSFRSAPAAECDKRRRPQRFQTPAASHHSGQSPPPDPRVQPGPGHSASPDCHSHKKSTPACKSFFRQEAFSDLEFCPPSYSNAAASKVVKKFLMQTCGDIRLRFVEDHAHVGF